MPLFFKTYTTASADALFVKKPAATVGAGKVLVSDGASDANWETIIDQEYSKTSSNAQSGAAVAEGIEKKTHNIIITTTQAYSAGSEIIVPAPTLSGGSLTYNRDYYLRNNSVIIPVADIKNDGTAYKVKYVDPTIGTDLEGNVCGYVTITVAETIPSGTQIGVVVINE